MGSIYEERAVAYLTENGYEILERNYRNRSGEIDIIAKKNSVIIAFEVKYRSSYKFGHPSMSVTSLKQKNISKVFKHFIYTRHLSFDNSYRFDVLGIMQNGDINHIENAFNYVE